MLGGETKLCNGMQRNAAECSIMQNHAAKPRSAYASYAAIPQVVMLRLVMQLRARDSVMLILGYTDRVQGPRLSVPNLGKAAGIRQHLKLNRMIKTRSYTYTSQCSLNLSEKFRSMIEHQLGLHRKTQALYTGQYRHVLYGGEDKLLIMAYLCISMTSAE